MLKKYNYRTFFYGNFIDPLDPSKGWITFDHRPRFGTNYFGLMNRFSVLSEAYAYADFKTRIDATEKFIEEILMFTAKKHKKMLKLIKQVEDGILKNGIDSLGIKFQIVGRPAKIWGYRTIEYFDSLTGEKKRSISDKIEVFKTTNYGEYKAVEQRNVPTAYAFLSKFEVIAEKLNQHGINVERVTEKFKAKADVFIVDSLKQSERKFQGHNETKLFGHFEEMQVEIDEDYYYVKTRQEKLPLIFYLLEPESDDGFVNWNFFDEFLINELKNKGKAIYPVYKIKN